MVQDWNALALFGVVGLSMTTSAALLVRTVLAALRRPRVRHDTQVACSCC
jgi:hypothetical protein